MVLVNCGIYMLINVIIEVKILQKYTVNYGNSWLIIVGQDLWFYKMYYSV